MLRPSRAQSGSLCLWVRPWPSETSATTRSRRDLSWRLSSTMATTQPAYWRRPAASFTSNNHRNRTSTIPGTEPAHIDCATSNVLYSKHCEKKAFRFIIAFNDFITLNTGNAHNIKGYSEKVICWQWQILNLLTLENFPGHWIQNLLRGIYYIYVHRISPTFGTCCMWPHCIGCNGTFHRVVTVSYF